MVSLCPGQSGPVSCYLVSMHNQDGGTVYGIGSDQKAPIAFGGKSGYCIPGLIRGLPIFANFINRSQLVKNCRCYTIGHTH